MATLAPAAPLLAGGPPGWVLYGLLAVASVAVGAALISEADKDADTTFDDVDRTFVEHCRPETYAPPDSVVPPVPKIEDPPKRPTCATEHAELVLCDILPPGIYRYPSKQAAFQAIRASLKNKGKNLKLEKERPTTSGPCQGQGTHTGVRLDGEYYMSIVCCPCCTDTATGPQKSELCGTV